MVEAYQQLEAEGYLTLVPRSGTRVAERAAHWTVADVAPLLGEAVIAQPSHVPVH